jgi:hypothetical protein
MSSSAATAHDFVLPFQKTDFFFTNQTQYNIKCDSAGCYGVDGANKVKDSTGADIIINKSNTELLDDAAGTCEDDDACADLYKKQLFYNKVLYNVLYGIQTGGQSTDEKYNDLVSKYNRDVFSMYMYGTGIIIILAILYKL